MEFTQTFKSSSFSLPSPDGRIIATIAPPKLVLRSASSLEIIRTIDIGLDFASRINFLRWFVSAKRDSQPSNLSDGTLRTTDLALRVLVADEDTVKVWDVYSPNFKATIEGASSGIGKVANVEFGQSADEILVFSECNVKLIVWSLSTGRSIQIRDPKFSTKGFGYRPRTGHLALLTRPASHDIVTVHKPRTYEVINSIATPTLDAQGLRWSPDGRWFAVIESASSGYKASIYTADGNLYKSYSGAQNEGPKGLGIRIMEWCPTGKSLAIGDYDSKITFLNNKTFAPTMTLGHPTTLKLPRTRIYQEQVDSNGRHTYAKATQDLSPPLSSASSSPDNQFLGISHLAFSAKGDYLASINAQTNTTVWLWSLIRPSPVAVLVHHCPVKNVFWHPTVPDLLLVQCTADEPLIYLWQPSWAEPRVVCVPIPKPIAGKHQVSWIYSSASMSKPLDFDSEPAPLEEMTSQARYPMAMYGDTQKFVVGYVVDEEGRWQDDLASALGRKEEDVFEADEELSEKVEASWVEDQVDDTFRYRHRIPVSS